MILKNTVNNKKKITVVVMDWKESCVCYHQERREPHKKIKKYKGKVNKLKSR